MASPIGHGLVGMAIARRLGVRSRTTLAITALAASLPDVDIIVGQLLYGDPQRLHRKATHTLNFAMAAGALAGLAGILRAESIEGERDLLADAMVGAAIVGSHVALDRVPIPEVKLGPSFLGMSLTNWIIDAIVWGGVARAVWPRRETAPERAGG
ncbi:MAG TPA: metal-dependent hydrolase [Dehalococcoidia bacterium]|nr:metal-dependent hydrolase [Dehalococcoidia bacterium]